jgi:hypothetical protein
MFQALNACFLTNIPSNYNQQIKLASLLDKVATDRAQNKILPDIVQVRNGKARMQTRVYACSVVTPASCGAGKNQKPWTAHDLPTVATNSSETVATKCSYSSPVSLTHPNTFGKL